jgi:hypothetical protein
VTVPVEGWVPSTTLGETLTPISDGGLIVSVADLLPFPRLAVILAGVTLETGDVVIGNVAVVMPHCTATPLGHTSALVELDDRLTTKPSGGAGPSSVTVPVDGVPPITDVGDKLKLLTATGVIVSFAPTEVLP